MGLITGLLTWPIAPVRGVAWVAEQVLNEAERQWSDPAAIEQALRDIDERRAAGELTAEEAAGLEDELLARLIGSGQGIDHG